MITRAPENKPAAPRPAKDLPMIRTIDEGAIAQIKLPSSKTPRKDRYAHFSEKF